jgi:hypothetical protein
MLLFGKFEIELPPKKENVENGGTPVFQLSSSGIKDVEVIPKKQQIGWEWRSFWPEDCSPIPVHLVPFPISSLNDFESITFQDTYISIKKSLLNLKIRKEKLVYKPVIEKYDYLLAFSPKKKFPFPLGWKELYSLFPRLLYYKGVILSPHDLVLCLQESHYQSCLISLQKNTCRYEITEDLRLELSQIMVHDQLWYSVCIESLSITQVRECADLMIPQKGKLMGYAEFLNKHEHN